jgi:hypothetical protein
MLNNFFQGNPTRGIDRGTYTGKSLVLDDSADYITRTFGASGNRKTWTISTWIKREVYAGSTYVFNGAYVDNSNRFQIDFTGTGYLQIVDEVGGVEDMRIQTNALYRDVNHWYNVVVAYDSTVPECKLYVDGEEVTSWLLNDQPSLNYDSRCNSNNAHHIGSRGTPGNISGGYWGKVDFIDGLALTASDFGHESADTGKWVASDTSGLTFGTNGFSLDFNDDRASTPDTTATIYDQSGNSNDWTGNSLVAGSFTGDTPVDNHATLNALSKGTGATLTNGNKSYAVGNQVSIFDRGVDGTMPFPSDDSDGYYFEVEVTDSGTAFHIGVTPANNNTGAIRREGGYSPIGAGYNSTGTKEQNNTATSYGDTYTDNERIGVLVKNNSIYFYNEGVIQNSGTAAYTNLSGNYVINLWYQSPTGPASADLYIDSDDWETTPTGAKQISSANLPAPDNLKPQDNANIVLYTGDGVAIGSGGNAITGVGFQPDFTWVKDRDLARNHHLTDSVRGVTNFIEPNTTDAESSTAETLVSFDVDGFTVGSQAGFNDSGSDYWSLNILADNTSGSSNTDGTITSTVATDGINFSIVTYTGTGVAATIGHGLAEAPDLIIVKERANANGWITYHASNTTAPKTDYLTLNSTDATSDLNTVWNDTAPTSSVFSVGTANAVNRSGGTIVAYCFKFGDVFAGGSYTGNGSADGTFIPSDELLFFCSKATSGSEHWDMLDQARDTYNPTTAGLLANETSAEASVTGRTLDFVSNGIKYRNTTYGNSAKVHIWWGVKKNGGQLGT